MPEECGTVRAFRPLVASKARLLRDNGLSIAVFTLFAASIAGQSVAGHIDHNDERVERGQAPISYSEYLGSGEFLSATMENWESEFLQMGAYVVLTIFLFQRGSSESKKPDESEAVDRDPRNSRHKSDAPGPVRKGGWRLALYEHSLSLAFFALFAASFVLHAVGSAAAHNEERRALGEPETGVLEHVGGATFWFESFQNWQSEFLSLGAILVLSIFLRQRGSPESKPVDAPHAFTGHE
jgi:hypothetical protein